MSEESQVVYEKTTNSDELLLNSLGYKQELRRTFTPLEVFGLGFSIIGLFPSWTSVLIFAIPNGGPSAMVWGWATCAFFLMFIALAMAELGSAAPTSGGLYYWTFKYSSPKWRKLLSWIVGYANTVGNIASVASVDWGCAVQIMAAASIGSGLKFAPTTQQTFGVYAALLISHAAICTLTVKVVARLQRLYLLVDFLLCLTIIIALPASTPDEFMNTAKFAFGAFENLNGWPNGYAFILSFLAPLWVVCTFDACVHISEEAANATVAVPWAIICACAAASVFGWAINVATAFCMGTDLESIVSSPIAQPMATILFNSFGQKGTLAIWSFVILVQYMMGTSMLTTCSRQTFAFSRDGGLPLSSFFYYLSPHSRVPVNCVWGSAFAALLLGLLAFAGPAAIGAVFSLVVVGQYLAYSIPISARFLGGQDFEPGAFTLGKLGRPVAVVAVTFMVFMSIVFLFPATPQTNAANMNYTVVVLGGTIFLSIVYYYFPKYGGVHWFEGPVANNKMRYEVEVGRGKKEGGLEGKEGGFE